tara:strand:+ start:1189 stop:1833 length:645 start_codon:yes stop_codon:yes gene_type:complete
MTTVKKAISDILSAENKQHEINMSVTSAVRVLNTLMPKWHEKTLHQHSKPIAKGGNKESISFYNDVTKLLAVEWANKDEHMPKFGKQKIGDIEIDLTITKVLWDEKKWKTQPHGAEIYSAIMSDEVGFSGVRRELFKFIGGRFKTWVKLAVEPKAPSSTDDEVKTFEQQSELNFTQQYKRIENGKTKGNCTKEYALEMLHAINKVLEINKKYMK